MAKTTPTTKYTIALGENDKFWQVFEDGNVRTSFTSQVDAEYWCTINALEYTVI
jgi:hypothetical protein